MRFLAALDSDLIALLVFGAISALSGLSNYLKKRRAQKAGEPWVNPEDRPSEPPPVESRAGNRELPQPAPVPRPAKMTEWEAELRRLLEGDAPPPQPPVSPPPVIVAPGPASRSTPPPIPPRTPMPAPVFGAEPEEEVAYKPLATFRESAAAHSKASHLHEHVTDQLPRLDEILERKRAAQAFTPSLRASPEAGRARELMRDRASVRQAIVASIVLGPPRCFEI